MVELNCLQRIYMPHIEGDVRIFILVLTDMWNEAGSFPGEFLTPVTWLPAPVTWLPYEGLAS